MNIRSGGKRREADARPTPEMQLEVEGWTGVRSRCKRWRDAGKEGRRIPGSRWGSAGAAVSSAQTSSVENGGIVQIFSFRVLRV